MAEAYRPDGPKGVLETVAWAVADLKATLPRNTAQKKAGR